MGLVVGMAVYTVWIVFNFATILGEVDTSLTMAFFTTLLARGGIALPIVAYVEPETIPGIALGLAVVPLFLLWDKVELWREDKRAKDDAERAVAEGLTERCPGYADAPKRHSPHPFRRMDGTNAWDDPCPYDCELYGYKWMTTPERIAKVDEPID